MSSLTSVSNPELLALLASAVGAERAATAEVIAHLAELDRRRLYLDEACSSLYSYCIERLGYSEDGAFKRVRVVHLAQRLPRVLDELASGAIHLTGLFVLSGHLTEENADALLTEARGKSRRQLEELVARWFPRPDVPVRIEPVGPAPVTLPGQGNFARPVPASARPRMEPLSPASYRLELTLSAALHDKLERLRNLRSHAVPSGDLAEIIEWAVDVAIEVETKRRSGAGQPRKRRTLKPGSRHVPVEIERAVRERDGEQCTFVDEHGRRCSEKRFLTLEHVTPFALGGPATEENLKLFCKAHNAHAARQVFGGSQVEGRIARARSPVFDQVLTALVRLGFERKPAERALAGVELGGEARVEPVLRAALAALTTG